MGFFVLHPEFFSTVMTGVKSQDGPARCAAPEI